MSRHLPLVVVLTAALLAGCSSGGGQGGGPESREHGGTSRAPAATESLSGRLPMARYAYTSAEEALIQAAQERLAQECMAGFGLSYDPPPPPAARTVADRRYGLSSAEEAAARGYGLPPRPGPDVGGTTDREALRVLYGERGAFPRSRRPEFAGKEIPEGGCQGSAARRLADPHDRPEAARTAARIAVESHGAALEEPEVRAAVKKWSSCMEENEYSYSNPMEAAEDKRFHRDVGTEPSDRERRTAVADVRCKERTGLLTVWFTAESRIQQRAVERNAAQLEELRSAHRDKTETARRIVDGSSVPPE
ncbi:hypothetical protein ACIQNG_12330 [Streptomyces sp. NPDC091377]|uniref:hypothetical protein n=1 Tax=Streptomyces sp. NPDC091377 TaxID=3365995 RepID=UPI003823691A